MNRNRRLVNLMVEYYTELDKIHAARDGAPAAKTAYSGTVESWRYGRYKIGQTKRTRIHANEYWREGYRYIRRLKG